MPPTPAEVLPILQSMSPSVLLGILVFLAIWTTALKAFALWFSARAGQRIWFAAMLIINTLGILELLYLFVFRKKERAASIPVQ